MKLITESWNTRIARWVFKIFWRLPLSSHYKKISSTTYYQGNKDVILNRAKDYYENNKEKLREQAKDKYRNLFDEE